MSCTCGLVPWLHELQVRGSYCILSVPLLRFFQPRIPGFVSPRGVASINFTCIGRVCFSIDTIAETIQDEQHCTPSLRMYSLLNLCLLLLLFTKFLLCLSFHLLYPGNTNWYILVTTVDSIPDFPSLATWRSFANSRLAQAQTCGGGFLFTRVLGPRLAPSLLRDSPKGNSRGFRLFLLASHARR